MRGSFCVIAMALMWLGCASDPTDPGGGGADTGADGTNAPDGTVSDSPPAPDTAETVFYGSDADLSVLTDKVKFWQDKGQNLAKVAASSGKLTLDDGTVIQLVELSQTEAALGQDGPMLQQLIEDTRSISETVSERRGEVAGTIDGLTRALQAAAAERDDLSVALDDLPATVAEATDVLERLPDTVDTVDPLLTALQPAIDQLPDVADDLRPLLADLRPAVTDLEPALANLGIVLDQAPAFFDLTTAVLPTLDGGLNDALQAVDFLRPYTPELIGFLQNWADGTSAMDENGRYIRLVAKAGLGNALIPLSGDILDTTQSLLDTAGVPGLTGNRHRDPGELVDQPWTDANGDPVN